MASLLGKPFHLFFKNVILSKTSGNFMPSIRWIRHLEVDAEPMTIEIMLGTEHISDKCYVRINSESEMYFRPESETRKGIISSGIQILKNHFKDSVVLNLDGSVYQWN